MVALFFTAWSAALREPSSNPWPASLANALSALSRHTPAQAGDRTLIDALAPLSGVLSAGRSLEEAVKAAQNGAISTRGMPASLGRAVYVGVDNSEGALPPDPGAWGVASIANGFYSGFSGRDPLARQYQ